MTIKIIWILVNGQFRILIDLNELGLSNKDRKVEIQNANLSILRNFLYSKLRFRLNSGHSIDLKTFWRLRYDHDSLVFVVNFVDDGRLPRVAKLWAGSSTWAAQHDRQLVS